MRIGYHVESDYRAVYSELAAMLHMGLVPYTGQEEIVVLDGVKDFAQHTLEYGQTVIARLKNGNAEIRSVFPFSLGALGLRALQEGFPLEEAQSPQLDLALHTLREILIECSGAFSWCVLPSPWGYAYSVALTHDIDSLSVKEYPFGRTFLGFLYRSIVGNLRRWRAQKITTHEFVISLARGAQALKAKVLGGADAWHDATQAMLALERKYGVTSSLYLMPKSAEPGKSIVDNQTMAPQNRAGFYTPEEHRSVLSALEADGWELGVHGIDAWADEDLGHEELEAVAAVSQKAKHTAMGIRIHWLYLEPPSSWQKLEQAGYYYDSTFGYNEGIGFRAGTLQAFHPLNAPKLWELPLHVQDGALLGEEHGNLSREEALEQATAVFQFAERLGGTVTLLWHNASFGSPRFWGSVYEKLLVKAQKAGAWLAPGQKIVQWYAKRRETLVRVEQDEMNEKAVMVTIQRQCSDVKQATGTESEHNVSSELERNVRLEPERNVSSEPEHNTDASPAENLPELALFVRIPAERVASCPVPWMHVENGILIQATPGRFRIELKG